jgi:hypothetical protein
MKNLKFGILAFGVLGVLGCFLPFVSEGGMSMSFFKMREFIGSGQVFLTMGGFVLAAVMGAMALQKGLLKWQGGAAAAGFALVLFKLRDALPTDIFKGAIGAKLIGLSAIAGLVIAILGIVKGSEE